MSVDQLPEALQAMIFAHLPRPAQRRVLAALPTPVRAPLTLPTNQAELLGNEGLLTCSRARALARVGALVLVGVDAADANVGSGATGRVWWPQGGDDGEAEINCNKEKAENASEGDNSNNNEASNTKIDSVQSTSTSSNSNSNNNKNEHEPESNTKNDSPAPQSTPSDVCAEAAMLLAAHAEPAQLATGQLTELRSDTRCWLSWQQLESTPALAALVARLVRDAPLWARAFQFQLARRSIQLARVRKLLLSIALCLPIDFCLSLTADNSTKKASDTFVTSMLARRTQLGVC